MNKHKIIGETLGDILRPKTREEIIIELDKISIENKIEAVRSYFWDEELLYGLEEKGADNKIIIKNFLKHAPREDLENLLEDYLLEEEERPIETAVSYSNTKTLKILVDSYFDEENEDELNDVLNDILIEYTDALKEIGDTLFDDY